MDYSDGSASGNVNERANKRLSVCVLGNCPTSTQTEACSETASETHSINTFHEVWLVCLVLTHFSSALKSTLVSKRAASKTMTHLSHSVAMSSMQCLDAQFTLSIYLHKCKCIDHWQSIGMHKWKMNWQHLLLISSYWRYMHTYKNKLECSCIVRSRDRSGFSIYSQKVQFIWKTLNLNSKL